MSHKKQDALSELTGSLAKLKNSFLAFPDCQPKEYIHFLKGLPCATCL